MVHGVVVHISMQASFNPLIIGNLTHIVGEICSLYSTSASARAVFSTTDHITGLDPQ